MRLTDEDELDVEDDDSLVNKCNNQNVIIIKIKPSVTYVMTQVDSYRLCIRSLRPYTCHTRSVYDRIFPVYGRK